jgi:hypothetical protein
MVMMWVLAPSARAGTTEAAATTAAAQKRTAFTETCMIASFGWKKTPNFSNRAATEFQEPVRCLARV